MIILIVALVCMGSALGYMYMLYQQCKSRPITCDVPKKERVTSNQVNQTSNQVNQTSNQVNQTSNRINQIRDRQVLEDALYPPLNRDHSSNPKLFYERRNDDRYRLVGYMVAQEDPSDTWKLFARDTGRGRANFYMMPSDKNSDIKVTLDSPQLRDIYDIPRSLKVSSPVLRHTRYEIMELQKGDLDSPYY